MIVLIVMKYIHHIINLILSEYSCTNNDLKLITTSSRAATKLVGNFSVVNTTLNLSISINRCIVPSEEMTFFFYSPKITRVPQNPSVSCHCHLQGRRSGHSSICICNQLRDRRAGHSFISFWLNSFLRGRLNLSFLFLFFLWRCLHWK